MYACTHRFGEKINIESLKRAMTDVSFLNQIIKQRSEAGRKDLKEFLKVLLLLFVLGLAASDQTTLAFTHNEELAKRGRKLFDKN